MGKHFNIPFANTGIKSVIPEEAQLDGSQSMDKGFTNPYQTPAGRNPELPLINQLFNWTTESIKELQEKGFAPWYATANYTQGAIIYYTNGLLYQSLVNSNLNNLPTDATKWYPIPYFSNIPTNSTALLRANNLSDVADVAAARNNLQIDTLRIGDCKISFSDQPQANYFFCQGQEVSRTTYGALFAAIGIKFGVGNGSTTFNLPNLQGRFPVGWWQAGTKFIETGVTGLDISILGALGGDQNAQQHNHTIAITDNGHNHDIDTFFTARDGNGGSGIGFTAVRPASGAGTNTTQLAKTKQTGITANSVNALTGNAQNIPPAIVVNFLIKHSI